MPRAVRNFTITVECPGQRCQRIDVLDTTGKVFTVRVVMRGRTVLRATGYKDANGLVLAVANPQAPSKGWGTIVQTRKATRCTPSRPRLARFSRARH